MKNAQRVFGCSLLVILMFIGIFVYKSLVSSKQFGIADMYCEGVVNIVNDHGKIYIQTSDRELNWRYYTSDDEGSTWHGYSHGDPIYETLPEFPPFLGQSSSVCNPDNSLICYRVRLLLQAEESNLEESLDAGRSWHSFAMPTINVSNESCPSSFRDVSSVEFTRTKHGYELFIGVGTEGIMAQSSDGKWVHHTMSNLRGNK